MAITLSVNLTDAEQAKLLEIAAKVKPGATPLEIKTWAEKQAKVGLRTKVQQVLSDYENQSMHTVWPEELEEVPPQSTV